MLFKAIGKKKSDRRGFTLPELLVVLAIMGLVGALLVQLFGSIWRKYRMVENLYIVQKEVQAIMNAYSADASQGSLATATNVDLLYEDPTYLNENNNFKCCPELGTFTPSDDDASLYFPTRDTSNSLFNEDCYKYTYLFVYKDHMYVLDGKKTTAYRFCFDDEIQVSIKYLVSVDAFAKDDTGREGISRNKTDRENHKFLNDGVTIKVESGPGYDFHYYLNTSFALKNAQDKNFVNYNNATSADYLSSKYCAGFCCYQCETATCERYKTQVFDYHLDSSNNAICPKCGNVLTNVASSIEGYPSAENFDQSLATSAYADVSKEANVIKYISLKNFSSGDITANTGSMNTSFNCAFSFLMADSNLGAGVLNTLRNFRDNTLRGTVVGDFIIDKYYEWSPTAISVLNSNKLLKDFSAEVVKDTAIVMEMVD